MVERHSPALSLSRQCTLLGLSRFSLYYEPALPDVATLQLLRLIDQRYLRTPYHGSRRMMAWLRSQGHAVGTRSRAAADADPGPGGDLPETQDEPAEPGTPRLSLPVARADDRAAEPGVGDGHHLHPDGPRLPLSGGDHRLVLAGLSWRGDCRTRWTPCSASRLSRRRWRSFGEPEIFNTDQGAQFTSDAFTGRAARSRHPRSAWTARDAAGQRLRRAAVALAEVRGGLSQGLRQRAARRRPGSALDRLLQPRIRTPIWLCD